MGVYGTGIVNSVNEMELDKENMSELMESFLFDELSHLTDERKEEFIASQEATDLCEAGIISRKTLVRLSKADDLSRRLKMAAMQLAKQHNDPLFDLLAKNRVKERELLAKIMLKYSNNATRVAKIGQKEYMKNALPLGFIRK